MKRASLVIIIILTFVVTLISCRKKEEGVQFLKEGSQVPSFTLRSADGTGIWTIEDAKGSIVIINFWATWCPSCREEMPSMEKFYKRFNGNGIRLLTVLYRDDPFQALSFMKEMGYHFPVYTDPEYRAAQLFGLTGVPETYIIGRDGKLLHRIIGPFDWDSPDFKEYISGIMRS